MRDAMTVNRGLFLSSSLLSQDENLRHRFKHSAAGAAPIVPSFLAYFLPPSAVLFWAYYTIQPRMCAVSISDVSISDIDKFSGYS